jgi:hypothetical protein
MKLIHVACFFLAATCAWAAPVPIFNGQSLEGWEGDAKWWRAQDGASACTAISTWQ